MASTTVLVQLLSFAPKRDFRRCVARYGGNHNVRTFTCWDQFVSMVVAQLGRKESLREIETCLRAMSPMLYNTGIRGIVSRSTLADANETRPSAIYADFCHILIGKARKLYANDYFIQDLDKLVYVIDSTIINLSLSLCPWSYNGSYPMAGVKLHTQLDLCGPIPSFLLISKAKMRDNHFLDSVTVEPGAFYVMDKGYFDLVRLFKIHTQRGYFVIRPMQHVLFKRIRSLPRGISTAIKSDQLVCCIGTVGSKNYPDILRKIRYLDPDNNKRFTFLTNNFDLPAQTIADLYKARWQIELFFKWIKQNLHITSFLGRSYNATQTQIWIAIAAYLLVAIAKKNLGIKAPLTEIISFLPTALFLKMPIYKAFMPSKNYYQEETPPSPSNQLDLL